MQLMRAISISNVKKLLKAGLNKTTVFKLKWSFTIGQENLVEVFSAFFLSETLRWTLYQYREEELFIFIASDNQIYIIFTKDIYFLVIKHYQYTLKNGIDLYLEYNNEHKLIYSKKNMKNHCQYINIYNSQCNDFLTRFPIPEYENYSFLDEWKQIINTYSSLRISLMWNAESIFDTKKSNNFLFHKNNNIDVPQYWRFENSVTKQYSKYIYSMLGFKEQGNNNLKLTSSWMSAISVVIKSLVNKKNNKILLIGNVYFEIRRLIEQYFDYKNISYFDPGNSMKKITDVFNENIPDAIFIDSSTVSLETHSISQKDFQFLCEQSHKYNPDIRIVLDTTMKYSAVGFYKTSNLKHNIIYVWSIYKYFYAGLDMGFWWYVVANKVILSSLKFSNDGSVINIQDALKIPLLQRSMHTLFWNTIQRKIEHISKMWDCREKKSSLIIRFPEIKKWNKNDFFWNCINIWLDLKKSDNHIFTHRRSIIQQIIDQSKTQNLDISYSSSYGFHNTTFCIFGDTWTKIAPVKYPFYIRISVWYNSQENDVIKLMSNISYALKQSLRKQK